MTPVTAPGAPPGLMNTSVYGRDGTGLPPGTARQDLKETSTAPQVPVSQSAPSEAPAETSQPDQAVQGGQGVEETGLSRSSETVEEREAETKETPPDPSPEPSTAESIVTLQARETETAPPDAQDARDVADVAAGGYAAARLAEAPDAPPKLAQAA